MNIKYLIILISLHLFACKSSKEDKVNRIKIDTKFAFFHDDLFSDQSKDYSTLKRDYPYLFPEQISISLLKQRANDTLQQFLYKEVKKIYKNFRKEEIDINTLFRHFKFHFRNFEPPIVITDISGISYQNRILCKKNLLLISLDMFLGKDHEAYTNFPKYLSNTFTPNHLSTAIAQKMIETRYPLNKDNTLLGWMIFEGKKMYLLNLFLPKVSEEIKFGYSSEKMNWAKSNESTVWAFLIKNEFLYSNDPNLKSRFIDIGPFSKFYLSIDTDSPGGIGRYIGMQIVKACMKKNNVKLKELMKKDAETILSTSGYKPKKNET